jgi:8-oxo-dGTP pyrophosphatase MutT (NUDIX family)
MPINSELLNIFQPGLKRGAARLAFAPHKRYFYVEHPTEGWRVYIRGACFLHDQNEPFDPEKFIVVKKKDSQSSKKVWEPPKGQMEGKDALPHSAPLLKLMAENVRREVSEEAKIDSIQNLRYTGLVVQSRENDYPVNHFFQYHIFQGNVKPVQIKKAEEEFVWLREHPAAFARLKSDKREKDDIRWFDVKDTKLMGRWSPSIVSLYVANATKI